MKRHTLVRLAGAAALIGGAGRVVSSFIPWSAGNAGLEALYDIIDVLFTLGLFGFYAWRAEALGRAGLGAFVPAVAALSFIGGPDADPFGFSTYQAGGAVLAVAMAALGAVALARRALPPAAPIFWMTSLVVGSVAGFVPSAPWVFPLAGALFGAAFALVGWEMTRAPPG